MAQSIYRIYTVQVTWPTHDFTFVSGLCYMAHSWELLFYTSHYILNRAMLDGPLSRSQIWLEMEAPSGAM